MSQLSLKSMLVPSKTNVVEYPGMPGFEVTINFLSREILQSIRKKYTKTKTLVSVDGKRKLNIKVPIKDLNEPKKSDTLGDYDCDELIEKEKAKEKNRNRQKK